MKKIITLLFLALFITSSLISSIFPSSPAYAESSGGSGAASKFCEASPQDFTPGGRNGADYNDCVQGYNGAVDGKSQLESCPSSMGGSAYDQGTPIAVCVVGYQGYISTGTKTPQPPAHPSKAAVTECTKDEPGSKPSILACEYGFMGASSNSNTNFCAALGSGSKTLGSSTDCITGYDLAKNIVPPGAGNKGSNGSIGSVGSGGGSGSCGSTGSGSGSGCGEAACEDGGYAFGWALCKIIDGVTHGISDLYNSFIVPELITPGVIIGTSSDPTHTFQIWSGFRVFGDIFLILALLIVVIVESAGGGLIDAYSIRKILPRILLAAIFVNISIYLVAAAVDISNVLGISISDILFSPFKGVKHGLTFQINPDFSHVGDYIAGGTISVFVWELIKHAHDSGVGKTASAAGSLAVDGVMWIIFTFIVPAFFIMLAILATIVFRRGLILFLIFVSPFAFALYCLPNTEKYFRQWWDLLFKALLIYPIIAVMFTMGNILSVTIASSYASGPHTSAVTGAVADTLGLISLFVPLFLIPFSFKIAGGLLGRFHEFATGAATRGHQGVLGDAKDPDSLRNRLKRNFSSSRNELGFSGREFSARLGKGYFGNRARSAGLGIREAQRFRIGQQTAESDLLHQANQKNDQYLVAHVDRDYALRQRQDALDNHNMGQVAAWDQAIAAADQAPKTEAAKMASLQALATTGFQFDSGREGYDQLAERVAGITGAQLQYETGADGVRHVTGAEGPNAGAFSNAMNNAQFSLRGAGRSELGGINNGTGYDPQAGIGRLSLYEIANGKTQPITSMVQDLANPTGHEAMVAYKELQAMRPNAKGAVADEIDRQIAVLESRNVHGEMDLPATGIGAGTKQVRVTDSSVPSGFRVELQPITRGDIAERAARTYQPPDPNRL